MPGNLRLPMIKVSRGKPLGFICLPEDVLVFVSSDRYYSSKQSYKSVDLEGSNSVQNCLVFLENNNNAAAEFRCSYFRLI